MHLGGLTEAVIKFAKASGEVTLPNDDDDDDTLLKTN